MIGHTNRATNLELVHDRENLALQCLVCDFSAAQVYLVAYEDHRCLCGTVENLCAWQAQHEHTLTPSCRKYGSQYVGMRSNELGLSMA